VTTAAAVSRWQRLRRKARTAMIRTLILAPIVFFAALFGTVHFQKRLIYNNWGPQPTPFWGSEADAEPVEFATSDGETLHGYWGKGAPIEDWALPDKPVVLFCHGNSWTIDDWRWVIDRWTDLIGADVLIFDYRGYGKSTGLPSEDGLYKDARAAYDYLIHKRNIDPKRIVIVGQSLGGGVALELAQHVDHRMLVLESTFTSMCDVVDDIFLGAPMSRFCDERFPSLERIRNYKKPLFMSHGTDDRLIAFSHAEKLFDAAGGPKQIWPIEGMRHNDQRDHWTYMVRVRAFMTENW
jgi:fermentation-respiration switch protein FrsA (DUF1100 family)